VRRQQVVTIQSRQFLKLPQAIQDHLFTPGNYTEMWPKGPDSIDDLAPRNIRIAYLEDRLLDLANRRRAQIELIPQPFDAEAAHDEIAKQHVLVICEGSRSRTFSHFKSKFGARYRVGHLPRPLPGQAAERDNAARRGLRPA
jgi:hypothetical protein